jgi:hypothetical protein
MITVRNEFETVPAWEHIAGDSLGTWSERETTAELIKVLDKVSQEDTARWWKELALLNDEDTQEMTDMQGDLADILNEIAPLPTSCIVALGDGEWRVVPYIDEEVPMLSTDDWDALDTSVRGFDHLYVVNDHGNVTCYEWQEWRIDEIQDRGKYKEIWAMV